MTVARPPRGWTLPPVALNPVAFWKSWRGLLFGHIEVANSCGDLTKETTKDSSDNYECNQSRDAKARSVLARTFSECNKSADEPEASPNQPPNHKHFTWFHMLL
jgi:hypothetical protein